MNKAVMLFLIAFTSMGVMASEMTVEQWNQYTAELSASLTEYAGQVQRGEAPPIKSGTPLTQYLTMNRPEGAAFTLQLFERHDSMTYTYGTDHFLLHYTNQGSHAIYEFSEQNLEPGVPDFVYLSAQAMEYVYQHLTGSAMLGHLGFAPPLSDGYYNGGGDGRFDVYFINMPYYGATQVDELQATLPITATSYMFLENDYAGFPGYDGSRNILAVNVTAAHEFFHSVQFAIDLGETEGSGPSMSAAWIEMSSVFMEEEHYNNVNDYYNYLLFFYAVPQWSLRTGYQIPTPGNTLQEWKNLHMYGSGIWPMFLRDKFGSLIVRDIWEICGDVAGFNWVAATDQAIRNASADSLDLREMYRRFALWNLFTGSWSRPGEYFLEAGNYPRITYAAQVSSYPYTVIANMPTDPHTANSVFVPDSARPDNLGANYVLLNNVSSMSSGLAVSFNPDDTQPWAVTVVGLPIDVSNPGLPVWIDPNAYDSSTSSILIPNAANFYRIALILTVTGGNQLNADYSLNITPLGEGVFQPNGGEVVYAGTNYQITWFFDAPVTSVLIELSTDDGQSWNPIATTENDFLYVWTVPNTPSVSCLIRISDADNLLPSDVSDEVFTIRAVGANRILDPYPNPAWVPNVEHIVFKAEQATGSANDLTMAVTILNMAGEKVRSFAPRQVLAGSVAVEWDFTNDDGQIVSAGPYLAVIEFGGQTEIKKFVVLR